MLVHMCLCATWVTAASVVWPMLRARSEIEPGFHNMPSKTEGFWGGWVALLGFSVLAWTYALLVRLKETWIHRRAEETWVHSPHCMYMFETLGGLGCFALPGGELGGRWDVRLGR